MPPCALLVVASRGQSGVVPPQPNNLTLAELGAEIPSMASTLRDGNRIAPRLDCVRTGIVNRRSRAQAKSWPPHDDDASAMT
jgi:hypothetical protein